VQETNKPVDIVQDATYPNLYRLKWEDGVLSDDLYNRTRAVEILRNYDFYANVTEMQSSPAFKRSPGRPRKAADALKSKIGMEVAGSI